MYIINFIPPNSFIYFENFLKQLFCFLVNFEPRRRKMLFFLKPCLPTYLSFLYLVCKMCAHQGTFIEHLTCTVFAPTYFQGTQLDVFCSQGNEQMNRNKW